MTTPLEYDSLDDLIEKLGLTNADLVRNSTEQLTFKQIQKARLGKPVTLNIRQKITNALNRSMKEGAYSVKDLFPPARGTDPCVR